ncbi:MAG: alpha-E domain-containing protein [Opitutales bacterium]
MLSRVADSLFWMGRYIERADNMARLLDVNLEILLDFAHIDDAKIKEHWDPILRSVGRLEQFEELYEEANSATVTEFLTFNRKNPESIVSCLFSARENARMIRDQISAELWEALNEMYLFLKSGSAKKTWDEGTYAFYRRVLNESYLVQGLMQATMPQDDRYAFVMLGRLLERAQKTTEIIDTKYHILLPKVGDVGGAVDAVQWAAVLKSCSAYDAYHQSFVTVPEPRKIAKLLVLSYDFPRSVHYCVSRILGILSRLHGGDVDNTAGLPEVQALVNQLQQADTEYIIQYGLHEYLLDLQKMLREISDTLFTAYLFREPVDMEGEIAIQQQQQQQ